MFQPAALALLIACATWSPAQGLAGDEFEQAVERIRQGAEQPAAVVDLAEACLEALAETPDAPAERDVRLGLAVAFIALERYGDAMAEVERAAELARTTGDDRKLAHALWIQAQAGFHLGQLDEAVAAAEEGLEAAEATQWDAAHWRLANMLGLSQERRGDAPAAIEAYRLGQASAGRIAEQSGDTEGLLTLLGNFGIASMNLGQDEEALETFEHVLELIRGSGFREGLPQAIANVGDVLAKMQRFEEARALHEEALELRLEDGLETELARSYYSLGCIDVGLGEFEAALEKLERSRSLRERLGLAPELAVTLIAMSKAYAGMDRIEEASDSAQRGVGIASELDLKGRRVALLHNLANILASQGDHEQALEVVREATELERSQRTLEVHLQLDEFRARQEAVEREHEVAMLSREQALQQLALDKRRGEFNALLIGGGLLALAAAAGWYAWASLRRALSRIQKLERERARAEHLTSIGVLAGGIAHDFNNILTIILGNASLLRGTVPEGARAHRFLDALDSGVERGKRLSGQLLSLSKGGSFARELMPIAPLVAESARFILTGAPSRISFRIAPDLWHGNVDPGQLQQLISNVVLNASQAMPGGGEVEVSAENVRLDEAAPHDLPAGPYVRITVADRGPGIAPEIRDRLFEPYFTTKPEGSGLGLALAYAIAHRHGGAIDLGPNPGGGTRAELLIPAQPEAVSPAPRTPTPPQSGEGRVLVMDDEHLLRDIYACALSSLGYECTAVEDGAAALDRAREAQRQGRPFDLAILDLTIPGAMGGLEALRELRAIDPGLRAIVASGYSTDCALEDPAAFGFTEVLRKPFTTAALSETVARAMVESTEPPPLPAPGGHLPATGVQGGQG